MADPHAPPTPDDATPAEDAPEDMSEDTPEDTPAAVATAFDPSDSSQAIADHVETISPSDAAGVFEHLSVGRAAEVAGILDPDTAGQIVARMQPSDAAGVITAMPPPEASLVLAAVDPDDRVDILEHVTGELHDQLMAEFTPADAADVRNLEQYPPDTAGGIMTTEVTALLEDLTAQQAIEELRRLQEELGHMFYVYVVDGRRHLVGVLSMRDLILSRPERRLNQFMRPDVASLPAAMDQEEVARLFRRKRYLALPVVDVRNRLVGLVTVDDVVDVINEEATEDVQKMFGAGAEERLLTPWQFSLKKRIWWLEVNLGTAFLAAWVVSRFDDVINALPILAAYQGIVSGMGGNAGAQALAVAVRGLALGENGPRLVGRVLYRETLVGLFTGVAVGLTVWGCALLHVFGTSKYAGDATHYGVNPALLGGVICLAVILNHVNACTTGALIPFAMKKLGFDPAQSATIFATTFTDCGGFFLTLWLAKMFLHL